MKCFWTVRSYTASYQNKPKAFIAFVHIHVKSRYYRVTRLVVLPDFQGIDVGNRLFNFLAELYVPKPKVPSYILTGNPQIIRMDEELENNEFWSCEQKTRQHMNKQWTKK